jgi:hypothetical protein
MIDELSLSQKIEDFLSENSASFSALAVQDCTMSQENLQRTLCYLCVRLMRSISNTLIMGGGG